MSQVSPNAEEELGVRFQPLNLDESLKGALPIHTKEVPLPDSQQRFLLPGICIITFVTGITCERWNEVF